MASKVILDADELERFARNLAGFNRGIQDAASRINADHQRLAETWRDPHHEQFARELEQTMISLRRFLEISDAYVPHLLGKANRARMVH